MVRWGLPGSVPPWPWGPTWPCPRPVSRTPWTRPRRPHARQLVRRPPVPTVAPLAGGRTARVGRAAVFLRAAGAVERHPLPLLVGTAVGPVVVAGGPRAILPAALGCGAGAGGGRRGGGHEPLGREEGGARREERGGSRGQGGSRRIGPGVARGLWSARAGKVKALNRATSMSSTGIPHLIAQQLQQVTQAHEAAGEGVMS